VHYNMGGIPTNYHGEVLTKVGADPDSVVPGLMAVGEAACVSVHGANRLGSNSLIDLVVFGRAVGLRCGEMLTANASQASLPTRAGESHLARFDKFRNAKGGTTTARLRDKMQRAMQDTCAVYRTGESLQEGVDRMAKVWEESRDIAISDRALIWNTDLVEAMEFGNLLEQAAVTVYGALNRTESRGAHAREDFPERDDINWMKHTLAWLDTTTGQTRIDYRPVHSNTMTNEVEPIPPKKRVY
jgi:succinate dehydrogenase / fumarate reductase, flavoprotein subunit